MSWGQVCEFCLHNYDEKIPFENLNIPGVYFIEIKNENYQNESFEDWLFGFNEVWLGNEKINKYKHTPNIVKKRANSHVESKEWIPLYIGKSKNIDKRIVDHITEKIDSRKSTLKLVSRGKLENVIFRLSIIKIEVVNY